jgi:predicted nuclease of restriction endonuclease-like RecB superfamily
MLSSELLRYKIDYKNNIIYPLLCNIDDDTVEYEISNKIIEIFNECYLKKYNKDNLNKMIKLLESSYKDYKLVRGLVHLMEKKCTFKSLSNQHDTENYNGNRSKNDNIILNSIETRRIVFQESAKNNIAVTKEKRVMVMRKVSDKLNMDVETVEQSMWSDLEENTVISDFYPIDPKSLLFSYNVSLIQTLLFNCIRMEIRLSSFKSVGLLWKSLLRNIKRMGLMYWLEIDLPKSIKENKKDIVCIIEGPLNILKLTEKYGVSMAKLVPLVINTVDWNIKAEILRTTSNGNNVIYNFEISEGSHGNMISKKKLEEVRKNLHSSIDYRKKINGKDENGYTNKLMNKDETDCKFYTDDNNLVSYDSNIEKNFAQKFILFNTGWTIEREPEPLITKFKTAFILDFILYKYQAKVLVEIIGFWTDEYLERKLQKIVHAIENYENDDFYMILIINFENLVMLESNRKYSFSKIRQKNNILTISYKNENISFKEIIPFLKKIETKYINQNFGNDEYKSKLMQEIDNILNSFEFSSDYNSISLKDINKTILLSQKNLDAHFNLLDILKNNQEIKNLFWKKIKEHKLVLIADIIFKETFIREVYDELNNRKIDNLKEACNFFLTKKIIDHVHIDLLTHLGFKIHWSGFDYSESIISLNT